jgi:hypothetical protein
VSFRLVRHVAFALFCSTSVLAQSGPRTFWEVAVPFSTVMAWEDGGASIGASLAGGVRAGSHAEFGAMAEWQGLKVGCVGPCGALVGVDNDPMNHGYSHVERIGVLSRVFLRSRPRLHGAYATLGAAMMHGVWKDAARPAVMTPAYNAGIGWRSRAAFSIDLELADWVNNRVGLGRGFFELSARWRLP